MARAPLRRLSGSVTRGHSSVRRHPSRPAAKEPATQVQQPESTKSVTADQQVASFAG
ncbi:MAG: hypothetical protein HN494_00130 [Opitutae bacterium]|nr:hypothetical protein [Opitutae bacterium]